jgi:hypothetical protein
MSARLLAAAALLAVAPPSALPLPSPPPSGPCALFRIYDEAGRRHAQPLPPPRNWIERRARRKLETTI